LDARLKTHPPSALGERYRGGFPPKQWTGWNAIAEDLALDLEDAPFRVCTAAKVAVEADNQNLTSGKVDWGAVENTIQTICYGLSPEADCLSVNPIIVDKKIADNGQGEQPAYLISFPLVDQKHGDWFSIAELAAAFPSRYNEMMDQWNRVQDGQPPQSSAIHENELGIAPRGIHPSSASPLVLQSAPSAGREPSRDNLPNVRTTRQDEQNALHDIGLRPIPEAANGVIHMFTNHTRTAPRDLASIPVPLSPPVPQTVTAAVPIHPIKSPGQGASRGKSVDVGGPRIVEELPFMRGQPTDDQARNIVMPPPVDSEEWKVLAPQAHPLIASNVVYLQELQQQERADMTTHDQNKVQKQEAKPDTRYSLTLLATCCEDSIERKKGDRGNNMAPENGTKEIQNHLSHRNPERRKLDVQQTSLVQSSPLRFRETDKSMPEKEGQAVDQPQASLTPPNEVRPKKFGCAPGLGSTPRYKNQNQMEVPCATEPRKRERPSKVKHAYPLRQRKKEGEEQVIKGDEPASELPDTEVSEYVDATTGSLEIDQVDYRLTAEGWEGAVITGAKAVGDSVDVWIKWPEEDASKRYPSSKLVGSDKVHCMMSLIKFYESKTKKRRSV
jgi:hypothetical protein